MVDKVDPQKVIGFESENCKSSCSNKDAITYAIGIGYGLEAKIEDLQYTYELHEDFKVFPTYATCLHQSDLFKTLTSCPGLPTFNPMMLLHGEQRVELYKPIKPTGNYITKTKVTNISDKGKGALLSVDMITHEVDDNGKETPAFKNTMSAFLRGLGGFGYKGLPMEAVPAPPKRNPCKVYEQKTQPNQALIYRLSGDYNPLHADPDMAALGGFDKPILHGLCTYGICCKAVVQTFCNGNGDNVKFVQSRFTSHVFPGETLQVSLWKEGNRVFFSAKTKERGLEVIVGAVDIIESPKL